MAPLIHPQHDGRPLAGCIVFVVIELLLIIIPFAFLELRPEATEAFLKRSQQWLAGHTRQLIAYTALILGLTWPSAPWYAWAEYGKPEAGGLM